MLKTFSENKCCWVTDIISVGVYQENPYEGFSKWLLASYLLNTSLGC